jgi:hypothetical protein
MNTLNKLFYVGAVVVGSIYLSSLFSTGFKPLSKGATPKQDPMIKMIKGNNLFPITNYDSPNLILNQPAKLETLFKKLAPSMRQDVINKVLMSLSCRSEKEELIPSILSIIDYSLPSYQKRLWVIDLSHQQLLYHTYVSHGLRSGETNSIYFSNANNSRASSEGIYSTKEAYRGREGSSLRLKGLDRGINDMAEARAIVMHGGFYVEEDFIKKYGRAGRSWGCPALPHSLTHEIINTIKDNNLLVVYYPSDKWFVKSKYLSCKNYSLIPQTDTQVQQMLNPPPGIETLRGEVLFANISAKRFGGETTPILAINANDYRLIFKKTPPLVRMLRRQIEHEEYIALDTNEFEMIAKLNQGEILDKLRFVVPQLTNNHGYVQTVMRPVSLGKIAKLDYHQGFAVETSQGRINLNLNHGFIRWLGL